LQRLLTTATIAGLLIATAAAFAITERLKLTKSAVYGTRVSHGLSPTCGCARGRARISFKLRKHDNLTVTVLNGHKDEVALLAERSFPKGPVELTWNGRDDVGNRAPDGSYLVRIHLSGAHQTITLPNRIVLDTTAPQVLTVSRNRDQFSPDGDRQADFVRFTYQLSKPARVILYLGGKRVVGPTYRHPASGNVSWDGKVNGSALRAGLYTLEMGAVDQFGNSTPVANRFRVTVQVRYITIAAHRITVLAGHRLVIGVSTDAKHYAWRLGKLKGHSRSHVLNVRAPTRRGRYTLVVEEQGHLDRAAVFVK
jgi:flagellar hook assembly protein FlgD